MVVGEEGVLCAAEVSQAATYAAENRGMGKTRRRRLRIIRRRAHNCAYKRKNALFAGHELDAEHWAAIFTLVEICKMLGHNSWAYVADLLARIKTGADTDLIDDLLPYHWVDTNAAQTTFEISDIARAA